MFRIQPLTYQAEFRRARPKPRPRGGVREHQTTWPDSNVVSDTQLALARAKYERAQAEVSLAEAHLSFTEIHAPFSAASWTGWNCARAAWSRRASC
jgi:membrane fusion protein (multidrug efflux system)